MSQWSQAIAPAFGFSLKPSNKIKAGAAKVGRVLDSKAVRGLTALAAGAALGPAGAAAVVAGQRASAKALQGKKLREIARAGAQGAVTGAVAGAAGTGIKRVIRSRRAPARSLDSNARLDALATGPIPAVGITGARSPVAVSRPGRNSGAEMEARDAAAELARRRGAEAARIAGVRTAELERAAGAERAKEAQEATPEARQRRRDAAAALLERATRVRNAGAAVLQAAGSLSPTGGGYSVPDTDGTASSALAPDSAPGMLDGIGKSPLLIVGAVLVVGFLMTQRR